MKNSSDTPGIVTFTGIVTFKRESSFKKPLLLTIPHSGEKVPPETPWLESLPETVLMYDVDRYVDVLYSPIIEKLGMPMVKTEWHRYAVDLNRWSDDVDCDSVEGHENASGSFPRGLHWSITTASEKLIPKPMPRSVHDRIVEKYFEPFHHEVRARMDELRESGARVIYHIDAHSMPSMGTKEHRDPGERRADVVVSDRDGKSCSKWLADLVVESYKLAGFSVAYNWPYKGGRVTETYGQPDRGQESIQVELNRSLYMDETTKRLKVEHREVQNRLVQAIERIVDRLPSI